MATIATIILGSTLFLSSCFQKESKVAPIEPQIIEIETELLNRGQVYYNLSTNRIVGFNNISDWDLAFDCRAGAFNILLNNARGMGVYNTGQVEFSKKYRPFDYNWKYDDPGGDPNRSAIGVWGDFNYENPQSFEHVYIVHLGFDGNGKALGMRKFKIHGFSDNHYFVQFADLDNENNHTVFVPKNKDYNYSYVSFQGKGSVVTAEPPRRTWDLCITPFHDTLYSKSPYSIDITERTGISEGVLTNRYTTMCGSIEDVPFDDLNYFDLDRISLQSHVNIMGSKWRSWDELSSSYITRPNAVYVLQDINQRYYALEYLEFRKFSSTSGMLRFRIKNL